MMIKIEKRLFPINSTNNGRIFREYVGPLRWPLGVVRESAKKVGDALRKTRRAAVKEPEHNISREKFQPKTVLAVFAHPDDAEQFFGGTAALLREKGHRVIFIVMTDGGGGTDHLSPRKIRSIRRGEAKEAAEILDVDYINLGFPDYELRFHVEYAERRISALIQEFDPDVIVTHSKDGHADHRSTRKIVKDSAELGSKVPGFSKRRLQLTSKQIALYYSDPEEAFQTDQEYAQNPFTQEHDEILYVNTTQTFAIKKDAFAAHKSQLGDNGDGETIHLPRIIETSKRRGRALQDLSSAEAVHAESFWQKKQQYLLQENILGDILAEYAFRLLPQS